MAIFRFRPCFDLGVPLLPAKGVLSISLFLNVPDIFSWPFSCSSLDFVGMHKKDAAPVQALMVNSEQSFLRRFIMIFIKLLYITYNI